MTLATGLLAMFGAIIISAGFGVGVAEMYRRAESRSDRKRRTP